GRSPPPPRRVAACRRRAPGTSPAPRRGPGGFPASVARRSPSRRPPRPPPSGSTPVGTASRPPSAAPRSRSPPTPPAARSPAPPPSWPAPRQRRSVEPVPFLQCQRGLLPARVPQRELGAGELLDVRLGVRVQLVAEDELGRRPGGIRKDEREVGLRHPDRQQPDHQRPEHPLHGE